MEIELTIIQSIAGSGVTLGILIPLIYKIKDKLCSQITETSKETNKRITDLQIKYTIHDELEKKEHEKLTNLTENLMKKLDEKEG